MTPDAAQLQLRARKPLPPAVYDYYAGGSGSERTLRANEKAWRRGWLAPPVLRDVSAVTTRTELLGTSVATPVGLAPTAFHRLAHPDGELATAAGAARAGAVSVLSTRSTCRIEDVAAVVAAAGGAWWFQVYIMRDRDLTTGLVRRGAAPLAGAGAVFVGRPVLWALASGGADGEQALLAGLTADLAQAMALAGAAADGEIGLGWPALTDGSRADHRGPRRKPGSRKPGSRAAGQPG